MQFIDGENRTQSILFPQSLDQIISSDNEVRIYSKTQTVPAEFRLSWSHYLKLMRIGDISERKFYEIESAKSNWSLRGLERQYDSALYTSVMLIMN